MVTPAKVVERYSAMPVWNKDSGKRNVTQMLVVHSAECPMKRGYAKSLTSWLNEYPPEGPWASINTFADPGVVVRSVHTDYASWHASWANPLSVGYETAAYAAFTKEQWLSLEGRRMLERLAIEMAADAKRYDIPLRWLTGEQVNRIKAGNRKIKGLAAHRQIDPVNRSDPGDGFPYGYLLRRIKYHSGVTMPATEDIVIIEEEDMATPEETWDENMGLGKEKHQARSYLLWTHRDGAQTLDNTDRIMELMVAMQAQNEKLVGAIAAVSKGEPFDEAKLVKSIEEASERGFMNAVKSITRTTTAELK